MDDCEPYLSSNHNILSHTNVPTHETKQKRFAFKFLDARLLFKLVSLSMSNLQLSFTYLKRKGRQLRGRGVGVGKDIMTYIPNDDKQNYSIYKLKLLV